MTGRIAGHQHPAAAHHTPMTAPAVPAQVPLHYLSTAMDEICWLRAAAAYEVSVNDATLATRGPKALATLLGEINDDLLIPAARGLAYSVLGSRRVAFGRPGWEAQRALRKHSEDDLSDLAIASEDDYLDALDEIRALRTVMSRTAKRLPGALLFKTLPTSRRPVVQDQIDRMKMAAGDPMRAYGNRLGRGMGFALERVAGTSTLNARSFAAEVAGRP